MNYFVIFPILAGLMFSGLVVTEAYGSVVEISFDDMVHQSELIVIGTVTEIVPTFEAGTFGAPKDQFFHDVTLDIDMTLSKDVSFTEVSFRIQKDRLLDGHTSDISTSQDFEVGERVLVFLTKSIDNDYWDGQYHVLGNHQGKYSLRDGQALGSHFNEISEEELISKIYETKQENKIPKYSLDSSFTLSYNQTALVADQIYVTFSKVAGDSRCPSDVACIWQGKASIQFDLRDGKYHAQKILSVGDDPNSIVFDTYKLELLDVKPNPVSTKQIIKSDYVITALVTKSGFITSPLKQTQSGVSFNEIQCKQNIVLIQKHDGSPACVTESTKLKLIERGWTTKDDSVLSKINTGCMTIEQSKQTAPFFKTPTYLPEGYSHVCSQSGTPSESYVVYHNKEVFVGWIGKKHLLIDEGAIFIYQIDETNMLGDEKLQTYGSPEQRTRETYDSVIEGNPSLNPQLITINGMLAYAVDPVPTAECKLQTLMMEQLFRNLHLQKPESSSLMTME